MVAGHASKLRPGVVLRAAGDGKVVLADAGSGAEHGVPQDLVEAISETIARGEVPPGGPQLGEWLEARHLLESERSRRVEAWGAAIAPQRGPAGTLPGAKFSCHGCGLCCESYVVGPISEAERSTILERADDLAPHVATPREGWFTPFPAAGGAEDGAMALGRLPSGRCVFLGADNLCEIHRHIGGDRKPFVCRKFPLHVTRRPDGIVVTIKPECGSLARSREDGMLLEDQAAWVAAIAAGPRPTDVARLIRVVGDVFVPYRLGRAIERRILGFLGAAPRVESALLAVRDLLLATLGSLREAPDAAALEEAETLAREAPLERLRAHTPSRASAAHAQRALVEILDLLIVAAAQVSTGEGVLLTDAARAIHGTSLAAFRSFRAIFEGKGGGGFADEVRRTCETDDGCSDPAVQDLARSVLQEVVASGRPLVVSPGLLYGYAHLALSFELSAWTARTLALRRGAARASAADWSRAIVCIERTLRLIDLSAAAPAVMPCLELPAARRAK